MAVQTRPGAIQVTGEVLGLRKSGDYHVLTLTAPGIAELTRPGHFVALGVGGAESSMLLRRAFSIYSVQSRGVYGGTVEIVFAAHGQGTEWLSRLHRHDPVDIVGPLGRPFALPKEPVSCVLVGGGYGSAPLFMLAEQLRARGCRVDFVLGAATEDQAVRGARGQAHRGRRSPSPPTTARWGSAAGSPTCCRRCSTAPTPTSSTPAGRWRCCRPSRGRPAHGAHAQCAVEESMACGIGVCMTCVLPVIGDDGVTRMVRSCVDGPVFRGDRVRWDDVGTVPADTLGAP